MSAKVILLYYFSHQNTYFKINVSTVITLTLLEQIMFKFVWFENNIMLIASHFKLITFGISFQIISTSRSLTVLDNDWKSAHMDTLKLESCHTVYTYDKTTKIHFPHACFFFFSIFTQMLTV